MSSQDDLFASLGGSLMKDLLGTDDDDMHWTLDQLEKELEQMEGVAPPTPASGSTKPPPGMMSAASLVVEAAQQQPLPSRTTAAASSAEDAWSQSLSNFTALSLADDFLAADSARKHEQQQPPATAPDLSFLDEADDYNVEESVVLLGAPPGLKPTATKPAASKEAPPAPSLVPPAPTAPAEGPPTAPPPTKAPPAPAPPVPVNKPSVQAQQPPAAPSPVTRQQQPVQAQARPPPSTARTPMSAAQSSPPQQQQQVPPPPPNAWARGGSSSGGPVIMGHAVVMPPHYGPPPVVVSTAPPPPPGPPAKIFNHTHPNAPPIPAAALVSSMMSSRDILFVVHNMLRAVLQGGDDYYHLHFLQRLYRQTTPSNKNKKSQQPSLEKQTQDALQAKSREWMLREKTLGRVERTDATRPRALLPMDTSGAVISKDEENNDDTISSNKSRKALWRARLRIDRAHQAYLAMRDLRTLGNPSFTEVRQEAQRQLQKLLVSLGLAPTVIQNVVSEILALAKGRTLLARTLEEALLPPALVEQVLPVVMRTLFPIMAANNSKTLDGEARLWRSLTAAVASLPLRPETLLKSMEEANNYCEVILEETTRMELVHALLRKGQATAAADAAFAPAWGESEGRFMTLLASGGQEQQKQ